MRVLLINPPYPEAEGLHVALSIPSIAAVLEREGVEVQVLDFLVTKYSPQNVERKLRKFKPDIVGITSVTLNYPAARRIAQTCKEISPNLIIVVGGPHVTFSAEETLLESPSIDIVVIREGDETVVELVEAIAKDGDLSQVKGIAFRKDSEIVLTPERPFIQNLDELPFPARHLLPISRYQALQSACGLSTSRGCPFGCSFCVGHRMVGKKVRYRTPKLVVDEIESLTKLGFGLLSFEDDFFTVNHKHCTDICDEIIARKLDIIWGAYARVDSVDKPLLEKMKQAGCFGLCFGVESGNQKILDLAHKKITPAKIREAITLCQDSGYDFIASFIAGLPSETEDTLRQSVEFAKSLGDGSWGFHILSPFFGTEVRQRAAELGLNILTNDWERYDCNQAVCQTEGIKAETLNKVVNELTQKYYERCITGLVLGDLSDREIQKLRNEISQNFVWQLLHQEVIEEQGKIRIDGNPLEVERYVAELQRRVRNTLDFPLEFVKTEIERLIDKNYLIYHLDDEHIIWKWNE